VPPGRDGYARLVASPNYARIERAGLCDLLDRLGPDQPTLCAGWSTRDLAAHLIVRERKPTVAPGIWFKPLSGRTARVQTELAARPFDQVIAMVRRPPVWSMSGLGPVDRLVNSQEFFIHHEDVRRAQPGWQPRPSEQAREDALWRVLRLMGRMLYRKSPVGVVLQSTGRNDVTVHRRQRSVTVVGLPSEIILHAFGRRPDVVHVVVQGDGPDIDALAASARGF
jgi:uncharacterized protein (TIGR03085 family)